MRPVLKQCHASDPGGKLHERHFGRYATALAVLLLRGRSGIAGEVIVADNGSTDASRDIARALGARVVEVAARGYGAALSAGIAAARGRYVIMGDSDDSYDFAALDGFVEKLRQGADLVMGNRFKGGIADHAMPRLSTVTSATRCCPSWAGCSSAARSATSTAG
jgi:glycosyltransferase involved in cell wall biosynthesis